MKEDPEGCDGVTELHLAAESAHGEVPGTEGAFPAWISRAVGFVHLQDADKKGIEFERYANKNICVLKSALSSWCIYNSPQHV